MKRNSKIQLAQLVNMNSPAAVFEEVKYNFIQFYPISEFLEVRQAFNDFNLLFEGKYPGYRGCNTKFHDKIHTTDALLAISRLIDGYNLKYKKMPVKLVKVALIATLLHDTGYIQQKSDTKGTGAKYTLNHVTRSMDFIKKYFRKQGLPAIEAMSAARMVSCTGLEVDLGKVRFASKFERTLGYMLGTADLLGQMASRTYLERLIYLYNEFKEGNVKGYASEQMLLEKTLKFYSVVKKRMKGVFKGVNRFASSHFGKRYGIKYDIYQRAIENQIMYLNEVLNCERKFLRDSLRRGI